VTSLAAELAHPALGHAVVAHTALAHTALAHTALASSSSNSSSTISDVEPGLLGFLVVAALTVALVFLLRSMNKQFRKIGPRPEEPETVDADEVLEDTASPLAEGDIGADFDPDAQTGVKYGIEALDVRAIDAAVIDAGAESGGKGRKGRS